MTRTELAQLLSIIRAYDGRQPIGDLTLEAWYAIADIAAAPYAAALEVVTTWFATPGTGFFDTRQLVAGLRQAARTSKGDIEADVRAAKARGIIPATHPPRQPLTPNAAIALAAARQRDRDEAAAHLPVLEVKR
jgi:hypothetical protein